METAREEYDKKKDEVAAIKKEQKKQEDVLETVEDKGPEQLADKEYFYQILMKMIIVINMQEEMEKKKMKMKRNSQNLVHFMML